MSQSEPITRQSTREITSLPVPALSRTLAGNMPVTEKKRWNTKNLLPRMGVDAAAAACAATLIAPIITTIDRCGCSGDRSGKDPLLTPPGELWRMFRGKLL